MKILETVLANYPATRIKDANKTADAWLLVLGEYSAEDVGKAARLYMNEDTGFFPTPAQIRKLIPRARLLFNESAAPKLQAPKTKRNTGYKIPDGMTEQEYLNSIIEAQIALEREMYPDEEKEQTFKNFLPFEI